MWKCARNSCRKYEGTGFSATRFFNVNLYYRCLNLKMLARDFIPNRAQWDCLSLWLLCIICPAVLRFAHASLSFFLCLSCLILIFSDIFYSTSSVDWHLNCHLFLLYGFMSGCVSPAAFNLSSFVFFSVHEIFNILPKNYMSAASI